MLQIAALAFGAFLAVAGLVLLLREQKSAGNKIKFLGQEFELSSTALVVVVMGCAIFALPFLAPQAVAEAAEARTAPLADAEALRAELTRAGRAAGPLASAPALAEAAQRGLAAIGAAALRAQIEAFFDDTTLPPLICGQGGAQNPTLLMPRCGEMRGGRNGSLCKV